MNWQRKRSRVWSAAVVLAVLVGMAPSSSGAGSLKAEAGVFPAMDPAPATVGEAAAGGLDLEWWSAVQDEIASSEYYVTWQEGTYLPDLPAAYQAPNRAENLRTYFLPAGPIVIPRQGIEPGGPSPWRWEARLVAWGREGAMSTLGEARLNARENSIAYVRGGSVLEQYRNDEEGLQQSFTLLEAPPGGQPLRLEVALGGDLLPQVAGGDTEISFATTGGTEALRYGGLQASGAAGEALPAWLSVDGTTLSIWIEDAGAACPIEVTATLRGLPPDPGWSITFGQEGARFGYSVATAGDVDGDGYSDVIVGVPTFDAGLEDEGGALVYHGWRDGLFTIADWVQTGGQAGARYGHSVAAAGDVNGDGLADVIVGAPYYSAGETEEGRVWIYHGTPSGLSSTAARHKESNIAQAHLGHSVATAGDVNNDGYADVIVGAQAYGVSHLLEGRVYVWHGGPDGIPTGDAHWTAESNQDRGSLGSCVATAGDVNGDGFADVIVGARTYDHTRTDEGAVFVWHGSAGGVNGGVAGIPTNAAWTFFVGQNGAGLGNSVSTAGDVNGDGYADVIVGAQLYDHSLVDEGGAWLFLGSATGLAADWNNFDYGNQAGAWFGYSVATAGDVNGDGYADVMVGAPLFTASVLEEGRAWVWHGSASGISATRDWSADGEMPQAWYGASVATAGDVNGDGYSEVIVGAYGHAAMAGRAYAYYGGPGTLGQAAGWTKRSNQMEAYFGTSVGTAGDVNGDGYADVIVGAPRWDGGQENEGAAWVYLGQATGLASAPHWYKRSNLAGAEFGRSVGTAGDVNGDGYDDVIVGAPLWHMPETDEGAVFVYAGSASGLDQAAPPLWNKASNRVGAQFGTSVGTAGDVNGDGYADIVVGAPFWQSAGESRGGVWLYYGSESGPHTAPDWYTAGNLRDAEYGYAVGTAGDVNGDGYSDVIVGSPYWRDDVIGEGRAWVYLGSRGGLRSDVHWHAESNNFAARMGHAVGTAGDVNGDGYADVIVGAPYYGDDGLEHEGKVWLFRGSAAGLSPTHSWSREGGQNGALYGCSVGTAGDVNGDGLAEVIIGIRGWTNGQYNEGRAAVYHGSPTSAGLQSAWAWSVESNQISAHYGASVGTAGDVNGDGYADVIVGAPNYDSSSELRDEGQAFLYYGNSGRGMSLQPRQQQVDGQPLAHLGRSGDWRQFRVSLRARTPFGRGRIQLEVEVKPLGVPFDGSDTFTWGASQNTVPGADRYLVPHSLHAATPVHWRVRWRYAPSTTPWMPAGRWVTMPWNSWNEQDLRTGGSLVFLPLVQRDNESR